MSPHPICRPSRLGRGFCVALLAAALLPMAAGAVPDPGAEADELAVYDALFRFASPSETIVMLRTGPEEKPPEGPLPDPKEIAREAAVFRRRLPALEEATLADFHRAARLPAFLEDKAGLETPLMFMQRSTFEEFFLQQNSRFADMGWMRFRSFTSARRLSKVSRVGFNAGRTQALVSMGTQAGSFETTQTRYLLEKAGGAWKVKTAVNQGADLAGLPDYLHQPGPGKVALVADYAKTAPKGLGLNSPPGVPVYLINRSEQPLELPAEVSAVLALEYEDADGKWKPGGQPGPEPERAVFGVRANQPDPGGPVFLAKDQYVLLRGYSPLAGEPARVRFRLAGLPAEAVSNLGIGLAETAP